MKLIGCLRYHSPYSRHGLTFYRASMRRQDDPFLVAAVNAANVNTLRRHAPYTYLFASDEYFTVEEWMKDDLGDEMGEGVTYRQQFESILLSPGLWLEDPSLAFHSKTIVTAILQGDVLTFIHLIEKYEFAMLCLPQAYSLSQLAQVIREARTSIHAVHELLSNGGFVVTVNDGDLLRIYTLDESYRAYFEPSI